jgi:hypothetical protein
MPHARREGTGDPTKHLAGGMKFAMKPLKVQVVIANVTPDTDIGIVSGPLTTSWIASAVIATCLRRRCP